MPRKAVNYDTPSGRWETKKNTPNVRLIRPEEDYMLNRLENPKRWTESELRKEYSRLRAVANKRLKRLTESEFVGEVAVRNNIGRFIPLAEISSRHELASLLNEVSRFIRARASTVTGQQSMKKKTIATLHKHNFDLQEEDYGDFGKFMEWARNKFGPDFDSDQAVIMYTSAKERGISTSVLASNFAFFQKNMSKLTDPKFEIPHKREGRTSAAEVFKAFGEEGTPGRSISINSWYSKHAKTGNWAKKPSKRKGK